MGTIHINKLKPGMVLDEEVRDINGRLLLKKGKNIQSAHIRIFRIWGVTEVNICGNNGSKNTPDGNVNPEEIEKIKEYTHNLFCHADLEHPALKEIFRISVQFRSKHSFPHEEKKADLVELDTPQNPGKHNLLKKLNQENITLPEIPSIVFELNEVIANPLSSAEDIAQVVQRSPTLTALLLKIVNSPFYGFPSKIDKISLAVTLIGTREISGLALGISVISLFKNIPKEILNMYSFLKHSLACGIISRILAAHKNIPQTEQLFVSGLLHDLGRLILYSYFPEEARNILGRARSTNMLLYLQENDSLGCNHTHIVKQLLQQWKLPMVLENNVFYHHDPSVASQPVPATLVHLADIITNSLGIGTSGERFVPPLDTEAWDGLGLSPTCFDIVVKQATHQFFALESMLEI
ncbi:MAG: HDOD domain-containing protein [Desulfobacterales bacterium]|nr:HDOD domain-containing protein [Desulfobacterales bacterium]